MSQRVTCPTCKRKLNSILFVQSTGFQLDFSKKFDRYRFKKNNHAPVTSENWVCAGCGYEFNSKDIPFHTPDKKKK